MSQSAQDLLREYAQLNRRRKSDGVTPLEYLRFQDLKQKLEKAFPGRAAPGEGGPVRIAIEVENEAELAASVMHNLRPIGLFIHTPFAPQSGERFELRVTLRSEAACYDGDATVVSNNVGPGFSTGDMGMGVRLQGDGSLCALLLRLAESAAD